METRQGHASQTYIDGVLRQQLL